VSQENVELHRRASLAYNAHDLDAFIAYFDPSTEFHSAFGPLGGGVYHGHHGVREYFRDLEDAWGDEIHGEVEAFFDLGEYTLAFYVLHGRGRQSGAEVVMPLAQVVRWRDALVVYFKVYARREDALRDLGISEDALKRIEP
jgi:ketosteroid isomerase-like protein